MRWLWDYTLGLCPIPLIFVFLLGLLFLSAAAIFRFFSKKRGRSASSARAKIGNGALLAASWAGLFVFFFYALWGFNYDRVGLEKQLHLEILPLDAAAVRAEAEWTAWMLAETRGSIPGATPDALGKDLLRPDLEAEIRGCLARVLEKAGYPIAGRPRIRPLQPGGLIMRFSASGFYFPYSCEGYIAANIMPAERPFVIAHEMVHAYGIADEGGANFLAFLACRSSDDPAVRYSGFFSYWEYVFGEFARSSRDDAVGLVKCLPMGVKADIRAVRENWKRYRGPLSEAAGAVYEKYLKAQGVNEGIKSYDRFVSLAAAWKRQGH